MSFRGDVQERWRSSWRRWAFPLAGFLALLWFCIRVIPKPSRARYPCQRASFPLATGFVVWLLSLAASATVARRAWRHVRRARYATALALLAGAAALWIGAGLLRPIAPAQAAIGPPNAPVGVAKGLHPGRVAWVYDPDATSWAGTGSPSLPWQSVEAARVEQMLSQTLRSLAGERSDAEAWDALFHYFNVQAGRGDVGYAAGEKVFIKVNFTLTYDGDRNKPGRLEYVDNSPDLTIALLKQLVNVVGVAASNITIGDPTRVVPNYWRNVIHGTDRLEAVNFLDRNAGPPNYVQAAWSTVPFYWSDPDASHWTGVTAQDHIVTAYTEATYLINFALLTSHDHAGVTLCAKNHFGSLLRNPYASDQPTPSAWYNMHLTRILPDQTPAEAPGMGHYRALVDLMGHPQLGGKTVLYLMDALYGAQGWQHVPVKWTLAPFNTDWTSSVFASQDPVAIDSVGFDFLYTEYTGPYADGTVGPRSDGAEDYLHEAAEASGPPSGAVYDPDDSTGTHPHPLASLGTHEHWNDNARKEYTRNLGTGGGIELVGVMLSANGRVSNPSPADGAVNVSRTTGLSWTASSVSGASYDVFFGTDEAGIAARERTSSTYLGRLATPAADPGALDPGVTYYWTVSAVLGAQTWPADVWSFTTLSLATAVANASPTYGLVPLTVSFSAAGSTAGDGGALDYAWDLDGDGALDDSTAAAPSWTYTTPGDRTVTLRVTDSFGQTDDATVTISVAQLVTGNELPFLTATAREGQNTLEWLNPPSGAYEATVVRAKEAATFADCDLAGGYPAHPMDGTLVVEQAGAGLGARDRFEHTGLSSDRTYCYSAFVSKGAGVFSPARHIKARPIPAASRVAWGYSTGASALAPTGAGRWLYAVSNDDILHAMERGPDGGEWPDDWTPSVMSSPAQHRPTALTFSTGPTTTFLASTDGYVYAFDATTGALLWTSANNYGMLLAGPMAWQTRYGGGADLLLFGTRLSGADNRFVALNPVTGQEPALWGATQPTDTIGIAIGSASVDYTRGRAYFTTEARTSGAPTVWAVNLTDGSIAWWQAVGNISTSAAVRGGRLYVGTTGGELVALDLDTNGTPVWSYPTSDGQVKALVFPDRTNTQLFFSTDTTVWDVADTGKDPLLLFSEATIPDPTAPLLLTGEGYLYVGSSDGSLYEIDFRDPGGSPPVLTALALGDGEAAVGGAMRDGAYGLVHVGTEAGVVYGVRIPLP